MRFKAGDIIVKPAKLSWMALRRRIVASRPTGYSWSYAFAPLFTFKTEGTRDPFFVQCELIERAPRPHRHREATGTPHIA